MNRFALNLVEEWERGQGGTHSILGQIQIIYLEFVFAFFSDFWCMLSDTGPGGGPDSECHSSFENVFIHQEKIYINLQSN